MNPLIKSSPKANKHSHSGTSDLVSARCESLPEEVTAACLALSLGEGSMSPHHLLPEAHLLLPLLRLWKHLALFGCHQLREKLEQEQVSEILIEGSKRNQKSTVEIKMSSFSTILNFEITSEALTLSFARSDLRILVSMSLRGVPLICTSSVEENNATRRTSTRGRSISSLHSCNSHSPRL